MNECTRRPRSYWSNCRCDNCTVERLRKHKLYSMGRIQRIPHEIAWRRLTDRFTEGWTALAAASACELPPYYFNDHHAAWRKGEQVRIGPILAHKIMTMGRPTAGQVAAEPSRRRLRALASMGYGLHALSAHTGIKVQTLAMIRNRNRRVGAAAAATIADIYDRLHMHRGDSTQAEQLARAKGWPPPLAWDDIERDPAPRGQRYEPRKIQLAEDFDPVVVMRLLEGDRVPSTALERSEALAQWIADGGTEAELCRWHGWKAGRYGALRLVRDEAS